MAIRTRSAPLLSHSVEQYSSASRKWPVVLVDSRRAEVLRLSQPLGGEHQESLMSHFGFLQ
jgi:hypothetical protein